MAMGFGSDHVFIWQILISDIMVAGFFKYSDFNIVETLKFQMDSLFMNLL